MSRSPERQVERLLVHLLEHHRRRVHASSRDLFLDYEEEDWVCGCCVCQSVGASRERKEERDKA